MNTRSHADPCARFEFEIADLVDEQLPPDRETILRNHLAACAACRAWLEEYANVDAALASEIMPVRVPADFEARLRSRIARSAPASAPTPTLLLLDEEYRQLVEGMKRQLRHRVFRDAAVTTAFGTGTWLLLRNLASATGFVDLAIRQVGPITAYGAASTAIALGALGWAAWRGLMPLARR
jgi:anti-sigma factor RsiW